MTCTSRPAGTFAVDLVQEGDEVGAGVAGADVGDHLAGGDLQCSEEVTGAVAFVVVGGPRRGGGQHRQGGGGAVQRLDLGFLVDRDKCRGDGRVHVEGDEVADLLHQVRVGGHLELVLAPRFEPEGSSDFGHGLMADAVAGGQSSSRPVRRIRRGGLEGLDHDRFDHVVADADGPPPGGARPPDRRDGRRRSGAATSTPLSGAPAARTATLAIGMNLQRTPARSWNNSASACELLCRRAQRSSVLRSSLLKVISTVGRPLLV